MSERIKRPTTRVTLLFCLLNICFITTFLSFTCVYAGNMKNGFGHRRRPPVNFLYELHDMHMECCECLACHHRYENGINVLDESELHENNRDIYCHTCHHSKAETGLREAFHGQCIGCHEKQNDRDGSSLPILCGECHVRKRE